MAATHASAFTQSRPWEEHEFADLLRYPGSFATGNSDCFALIRVTLDEAELLTIATRPDRQRRGLASSLMVQWQALAYERGARRAFLEVAEDNPAAIALYRHTGYDSCGSRPGYYRRSGGKPVDALIMARNLP